MRLSLECFYCGNKWDEHFYYKESVKDVRCPKCKDHNIKAKEYKQEDTDPFGYNHKEKKCVPKT